MKVVNAKRKKKRKKNWTHEDQLVTLDVEFGGVELDVPQEQDRTYE